MNRREAIKTAALAALGVAVAPAAIAATDALAEAVVVAGREVTSSWRLHSYGPLDHLRHLRLQLSEVMVDPEVKCIWIRTWSVNGEGVFREAFPFQPLPFDEPVPTLQLEHAIAFKQHLASCPS